MSAAYTPGRPRVVYFAFAARPYWAVVRDVQELMGTREQVLAYCDRQRDAEDFAALTAAGVSA